MNNLKTLNIFDLDSTLFLTNARTKIEKDGKFFRYLSDKEYDDHYSLKDGEMFNFDEFRSESHFAATSTKNGKIFNLLESAIKEPLQHNMILTARGAFSSMKGFDRALDGFGLDSSKIDVICSGDLTHITRHELRKAFYIDSYLATCKFHHVNFYDDITANLVAFLDLQKKYPLISFRAFQTFKTGEYNPFP